jgi:hypothetical protein
LSSARLAEDADAYETLRVISASWEVVDSLPHEGKRKELAPLLTYDVAAREFITATLLSTQSPIPCAAGLPATSSVPFREVISSALLLYRLLCIFSFGEIPGVGGGPAVTSLWELALRTSDGHILILRDHCGLADAQCIADEMDEVFLKSVGDLLTFLCSDRCPHPYDGTVAGCVA